MSQIRTTKEGSSQHEKNGIEDNKLGTAPCVIFLCASEGNISSAWSTALLPTNTRVEEGQSKTLIRSQ
jgi:hypothetical protein